MKKCPRCQEEKENKEFHKQSKSSSGLTSYCKTCVKSYARNNKEAINLSKKKYRQSNVDKSKKYSYQRKRTLEGKYTRLKATAKHRGLEMSLTLEQYKTIMVKNVCFYDGQSLLGSGGYNLDRIDNSQGYTINNVVPCCSRCNYILGRYSKKDLLQVLPKIISTLEREIND